MIAEWSLAGNELGYSAGDASLRLYPATPDLTRIRPAPTILAPSQFCLYEWVGYRLRVSGATALRVQQGSVTVEPDRDGFFPIRYENALGRSVIAVELQGRRWVELPVEVLSPQKYPEPAEYLAFYGALLSDLAAQAAALPFAVAAPTQAGVAESPVPSSPLFALNFFRQHVAMFRTALGLTLAEPHRQLIDEPYWPTLAEASEVDQEVVLDMLMYPDRLVPATHLQSPLTRRLGGRAPVRVLQRLKRETFDTAENRFAKMALQAFQRALDDLRRQPFWQQVPTAIRSILEELRAMLAETLGDPLFDEVQGMTLFPAASTVLLRRDGYRELTHLWRVFQLARRPFFGDLHEAIELRDVARLYEFWCFFRLANLLESVFGQRPQGHIVVTDAVGLEYEAIVEWPEDVRLIYNRRRGEPSSYSTRLHPDYVLLRPGRAPVIFDAKFRFTVDQWADTDDDPERSVQKTDLYKMHTYRDALKARSAVVLYPGNRPIFYDSNFNKETGPVDVFAVLDHSGVGALCLEPG